MVTLKWVGSVSHNRGSHTTSENENFSENEKLLRILRSQSRDVVHGSVVTSLWGRFWHGE